MSGGRGLTVGDELAAQSLPVEVRDMVAEVAFAAACSGVFSVLALTPAQHDKVCTAVSAKLAVAFKLPR